MPEENSRNILAVHHFKGGITKRNQICADEHRSQEKEVEVSWRCLEDAARPPMRNTPSHGHQTVRERWPRPKQLGGDRLKRKEVRQVGSHGKKQVSLQETRTDGREVSRPYAQQSTKTTDDDDDEFLATIFGKKVWLIHRFIK